MAIDIIGAVAIPFATVSLGLLGGLFVTCYHRLDRQKARDAQNMADVSNQAHLLRMTSGIQIVEGVNSNNDFPSFGDNLTCFFSRIDQLHIKLNVDLKGCATGGQQ